MCHSHYENWRTRQHAYGRWQSVYVDAGPARERVAALRATGLGLRRIAELTGVRRGTLTELLTGRQSRTGRPSEKVLQGTAEKILAVPVPEVGYAAAADHTVVSALGATRRLQALVAAGWPASALAPQLGMTDSNLSQLVTGRQTTCTAARARAVAALFAELQMTPGPSDRATQRGRTNGWPLPMEWDEEVLDDPDATPQFDRWTPASSTAERRDQVAVLTAKGLSTDQIAERLGVTRRTVTRIRSAA